MRSSKSRSRSKPNRPRSLGNIVNRVFDSSGPEGKVRGTPAQLIEKYQFLARDAQLSNDRVAAENFLQHSEHYTRLLAEAMREMAAEQEQRQQYQPHNGGQSGNNQGQGGSQNGGQSGNNNGQNQPRDRQPNQGERRDDRGEYRQDYRSDYRDPQMEEQPVIGGHHGVDEPGYDDAGLVETPEAALRPVRADEPRRNDRPRSDNDRPRSENERPRNDRPRDEQRRTYPPRVDQPRRDPAPPRVEQAEMPVAAAPAPQVETAPVVAMAAATHAVAKKPVTRSRAPKKPASEATDPKDAPVD